MTQPGQLFRDRARGLAINLLDINEQRAVVRVESTPAITSVEYNGGKKIAVIGSRFGSLRPQVLINGVDRSEFIQMFSDKKIKIKGSPVALGLRSGQNSIQIVTGDGLTMANVFIFTV